ncbi:MAG TPA: hypothetical protein VH559_02185 [Gemmatimonadaceae bacterium]|jgi:hypothetical protein
MTDTVTSTKRTFHTLVVAASVIVAFAAACSEFTGVPASLPTLTDSGTVFALNGAPANAPTALHLYTGTRLAADASFTFDIAFDIDADGNPVILPLRTVASGLAGAHTVSLQNINQDFSTLEQAPKSGYRADTALVTRVGQTIAIQSLDGNICGISVTGTSIYAKLVVLSLNPNLRTMSIQYTVDPNCGFVSFLPGIPKD